MGVDEWVSPQNGARVVRLAARRKNKADENRKNPGGMKKSG